MSKQVYAFALYIKSVVTNGLGCPLPKSLQAPHIASAAKPGGHTSTPLAATPRPTSLMPSEPTRDATVMAARALAMLAEAIRAIAAFRAGTTGVLGPANGR